MRKPRVLVIDDDPTIARIAKLTLRNIGYDVAIAEDTKTGLKELFNETTDLLLLDYMLPEQNGLAFLKDIRAVPELRFLPVIMLTTIGSPDVVQAAKILGVDDFITKPFTLNTLVERVTRLVPIPEENPTDSEEQPS
jgi:two-component system phosphate regulon response regulator PhoB